MKETRKTPDFKKEVLEDLYYTRNLSMEQIAQQFHCSPVGVWRAFKKLQIPTRTISEAIRLKVACRQWHNNGPSGNSPNWRGGKTTICGKRTGGGYIKIKAPEHARTDKEGYALEHILVWERVHNQALPPGYQIHHLNGIGTDNRPMNLVAMPNKAHSQFLQHLYRRIRELEAENEMLKRSLERGQMIFLGNN